MDIITPTVTAVTLLRRARARSGCQHWPKIHPTIMIGGCNHASQIVRFVANLRCRRSETDDDQPQSMGGKTTVLVSTDCQLSVYLAPSLTPALCPLSSDGMGPLTLFSRPLCRHAVISQPSLTLVRYVSSLCRAPRALDCNPNRGTLRRFSAEPRSSVREVFRRTFERWAEREPLRFRVWECTKLWLIRMRRMYVIFASIATATAVGALYVSWMYGPQPARTLICAAFEKGLVPPQWTASDALADVPRPALEAALSELLRPGAIGTYGFVVGEHGSGKSTAVRKAARVSTVSSGKANGVVYFDAGNVRRFSLELADSLSVSTPEIDWVGLVRRRLEATTRDDRGPPLSDEPLAMWLTLAPALMAAADDFRTRHGRPMTLVIDSTHAIAKECPQFLDRLQDFAKTAADTGNLRVVFVSSDEAALVRMQERSVWSRAAPPVEVGDISDDAATAFLMQHHSMERAFAADLVRVIAGGRFALLLGPFRPGESVSDLRVRMDSALKAKLLRLKQSPTSPFFKKLSASGSVRVDEALLLLGCDGSAVGALLAADIISAHASGVYTAHSRHVSGFLKRAALDQDAEMLRSPAAII